MLSPVAPSYMSAHSRHTCPNILKIIQTDNLFSFLCTDSLTASVQAQKHSDTSNLRNNLQSTLSEPLTLDMLLAKEVKGGFMIHPLFHPPLQQIHISPIGVVTQNLVVEADNRPAVPSQLNAV